MPENVLKTDEQSGTQSASQTGGADGLATNVSGSSSALVASDTRPVLALPVPGEPGTAKGISQDEPSVYDLMLSEVLEDTPSVFKDTISELTEQTEQAMRMHYHFNNESVNGTNIEMGTGAEETAVDYLRAAIDATAHKKDLLKTLISIAQKSASGGGKCAKKKGDGVTINAAPGSNVSIAQAFGNRRQMLRAAKEQGGSIGGKLTETEAVVAVPDIDSTNNDAGAEE